MSVFDDIVEIAKAQNDAYLGAYQAGVDSCQPRIKRLETALQKIATQPCVMAGLRRGADCGLCVSCIARTALLFRDSSGSSQIVDPVPRNRDRNDLPGGIPK